MKSILRMMLVVLLLIISSLSYASLEIEDNIIFKQILEDLKNTPSAFYESNSGEVYYLPEEVRADLILTDIIDQVSLVLDDRKYLSYKTQLDLIKTTKPLNTFIQWYDKLTSYANTDKKFEKELNNNLVLINYSKLGHALIFPIKVFIKHRSKLIRTNKLINDYNEYAYDPEAPFLLNKLKVAVKPFNNTILTATKFKELKLKEKRALKKIRETYYENYCQLIEEQDELFQEQNMMDLDLTYKCHPKLNNPIKARAPIMSSKILRTESIVLYNALQTAPDKHTLLELINREIPLVKYEGQLLLLPSQLHKHIQQIQDIVHDNTYRQLLSQEDDELILILRRWIKEHYDEIERARKLYNLEHQDAMVEFHFKHEGKRIPRRAEIFENYQTLLTVLPDEPWNETLKATILSKKGRHIILGKNWLGRLGFAMGRTMKKVMAPENVISSAAGVAIFASTGSLPIASASRVLIHDSVNAIIHDKGFVESFRNTPKDLALSLVTSSGFTGGHLMKLIAIDATEAGIRARLTGQDFATSLLIGGATGALRGLLPTEITRPVIGLTQDSIIDKNYIVKATMLEVATRSLNHAAQGAAVAMLTDETPLAGALKGAAFGAGFTGFYTSMFGVKYDVIGLYGRENLEQGLKLELEYNELVKTFGVVDSTGHAEMGMELFEDTDWRVGGLWSKVQPGASFSGFGFIHSPGAHVKNYLEKDGGNISIMTHEVGVHDLQKEYNGIFNFLIDYGKEAWQNGTAGNHDNAFLLREAFPDRTFNKFEQYRVGGAHLPSDFNGVATISVYETGNTVYYLIIEDLASHARDSVSVPYWAQ